METATLSSKYQILIPKSIREALHLKAGQRLTFVVKGNFIQLLPEKSLDEMRGFLKGANPDNTRDRKERV